MGGCMNTGGVCIGCTMPGFPDRFSPFYKKPPGANISSAGSKVLGTFMRPLRRISQAYLNKERRWVHEGEVPSGWGHVEKPGPIMGLIHKLYVKYQFLGSKKTWKAE
jgi:hydrogenase small subunit